MKVVLFCGGLGTRIRDYPEPVPKPMVTIGYRPILWHVMKYYAHYGYKDFILCLGYKADVVKNYFLHYDECVSNNFVLAPGQREPQLLNRDIQDWRITFVDTGMNAKVGERLMAVKDYLDGETEFLANYSDGLTDLPLPEYVENFRRSNKVGSFLAVPPPYSSHVASFDGDVVQKVTPINTMDGMWINGGFFVFKKEIFDYMRDGEELVEQPFGRLIEAGQLIGYKYPAPGYWTCMDTFKDRQQLEELCNRGTAPWEVWKPRGKASNGAAANGNGAKSSKVPARNA